MVKTATTWGRNGLQDWLLQRVTAVILGLAWLFVLGYILLLQPTQSAWQALWQHSAMQIAGSLILLSLLVHSWIGVWTVTTDYIKCTALRLVIQVSVAIGLWAQLLWGIHILWQA